VTLPVLDSVTDFDPEGPRAPDQPSPEVPPDAEHASAFFELQVKETL
jgi:hypothetical protein